MNSSEKIRVSTLGKTWILDIDGTIAKHNGYKIDGHDTLLEGIEQFLNQIDEMDFVIFVTSRTESYKEETIKFLKDNNIRYNHIIFNAPYGERIVVNDKKPSGLLTALAINTDRDIATTIYLEKDETL